MFRLPPISLSLRLLAVAPILASSLTAQTPAATRVVIQQAVRAYVEAKNKGDTAALAELYSREPGVTLIEGELITRGGEASRSEADPDYRMTLDSIDVIPLGPGYAMAIASYAQTLASGRGDASLEGAMTLLFKRVDGRWRIIHSQLSTATRAEVGRVDNERGPYVASMRSDLRRLIVAEEDFFADSVKYTTRVGPGGVAFTPSEGNTAPIINLTPDGWTGIIGNAHTRVRCYIFVGFTSLPPATKEGMPTCA